MTYEEFGKQFDRLLTLPSNYSPDRERQKAEYYKVLKHCDYRAFRSTVDHCMQVCLKFPAPRDVLDYYENFRPKTQQSTDREDDKEFRRQIQEIDDLIRGLPDHEQETLKEAAATYLATRGWNDTEFATSMPHFLQSRMRTEYCLLYDHQEPRLAR